MPEPSEAQVVSDQNHGLALMQIPIMVPVILEVVVEEEEGDSVEVPLTPDTTCRDVIECVRDPGEENCSLIHAWGNTQRTLKETERPLEILQQWGSEQDQVKFILRYTVLPGGGNATRNGMKEPELVPDTLCGGVELSVVELEAMAMRQEEQMASQRQLLAAKEQRLRLLKQHEARHNQVAQEHDRLRRLRDRVEAQELKLQKLRALRGQVDHNKVTNASLTSDLDSIRALFNEKEKELTMAVAKVEELTRQLEEVRRGKAQQAHQPPGQASQELDRLRRELMYRNKLNEQQSARLSEQREALCQRQIEMASIDKRIAELQDRLHRKRMLNQQLANQITAASNKANTNNQQNLRSNMVVGGGLQQQQMYQGMPPHVGKPMMRPVPSGNIAAVEPYHHVPTYPNANIEQEYLKRQDIKPEQPQQRVYNNSNQDEPMGPRKPSLTAPATHHYVHELKKEEKHENENLSEFGASKSDPKYQTLPYNTKFAMNSSPVLKTANKRASGEGNENLTENIEMAKNNNNNNNNNFNHVNNNNVNQLNVAHSIPIQAGANKGLAMALANQKHSPIPSSASSTSSTSSASSYPTLSHLAPRVFGNNLLSSSLMVRGQPVGGTSSTTSSTSSLATNSSASSNNQPQVACSTSSSTLTQPNTTSRITLPPTPLYPGDCQKPISSVPPTALQHPSNIYQTSSTKIHPVQPQTINSTPQVVVKEETETSKPALPPKPAVPVKPTPPPPPRQTHNPLEVRPSIDVSSEAVDTALSVLRGTINLNTRGGTRIPDYGQNNMESSEIPPLPTSEPPDEPLLNRRPMEPIIKAKPLTIKKQPPSELPRLRNFVQKEETMEEKRPGGDEVRRPDRRDEENGFRKGEEVGDDNLTSSGYGNSRRIEMPPAYLFPETETPPADLIPQADMPSPDQTDRCITPEEPEEREIKEPSGIDSIPRRVRKGNLKGSGEKQCLSRRVSFDPLALLLDASLEGELELVMRTASQVRDPSAANDEGITALHNAICAGHFDIVTFLVKFGCDVNAQDSDGWTPLHCAASCNNVAMVRFLVEHGACIFATTLSDHETAAEKCEEDEEGFDGCSEYLYSVQEKLGIMNNGVVYSVFDYEAHNSDELSFKEGDKLVVLRKGDEWEREWWWARLNDTEGYIPRNLLGLYPRVHTNKNQD